MGTSRAKVRRKAWRRIPEVRGCSASENEEKKNISEKQTTAILTRAASGTRYRERHVAVCPPMLAEPGIRSAAQMTYIRLLLGVKLRLCIRGNATLRTSPCACSTPPGSETDKELPPGLSSGPPAVDGILNSNSAATDSTPGDTASAVRR